MRIRVSAKALVINTLNISVFIAVFIYMLMCWNTTVNSSWSKEISIICAVLFIYQCVIMRICRVHYYSLILWFSLMNFVFMFGRIILVALGYESKLGWNLFRTNSPQVAYKAALYCLTYVQAIFSGMILKRMDNRPRKKERHLSDCELYTIAVIILLIAFPFRLYTDIMQIMAQRNIGGYIAVVDGTSGTVLSLSQLFPIAIIYMIASPQLKRKTVNCVLFGYSLYSVIIMVLSGDRRYAIVGLIASVLCYMRKYAVKLNLSKIVLLGFLAFIVLEFLSTIRHMRNDVIYSLDGFLQGFKNEMVESNPIYELFNEFGLTFFTYMLAVKNIPSVINYKFGISYIAAALGSIPGMSRLMYSFINSNNIYLSVYALEQQALGGALGQELYGNFGIMGTVVAVFAGWLLIKELGEEDQDDAVGYANYYALFYLFLNLIRASIAEIFRTLVFYLLLIYFIHHILKRKDISG